MKRILLIVIALSLQPSAFSVAATTNNATAIAQGLKGINIISGTTTTGAIRFPDGTVQTTASQGGTGTFGGFAVTNTTSLVGTITQSSTLTGAGIGTNLPAIVVNGGTFNFDGTVWNLGTISGGGGSSITINTGANLTGGDTGTSTFTLGLGGNVVISTNPVVTFTGSVNIGRTLTLTSNETVQLNGMHPFSTANLAPLVVVTTNQVNNGEIVWLRLNEFTGQTNVFNNGYDVADMTNASFIVAAHKYFNGVSWATGDGLALYVAGPYRGMFTYGNRLTPAASHTFVAVSNDLPTALYYQSDGQSNTEAIVTTGNGTTRSAVKFGNFRISTDPTNSGLLTRWDFQAIRNGGSGDITNTVVSVRDSSVSAGASTWYFMRTNGVRAAYLEPVTGEFMIGTNATVAAGQDKLLQVHSPGHTFAHLRSGASSISGVDIWNGATPGWLLAVDGANSYGGGVGSIVLREQQSGLVPFRIAKGSHQVNILSNLVVGGTIAGANIYNNGSATVDGHPVTNGATILTSGGNAYTAITTNNGQLWTGYQVFSNGLEFASKFIEEGGTNVYYAAARFDTPQSPPWSLADIGVQVQPSHDNYTTIGFYINEHDGNSRLAFYYNQPGGNVVLQSAASDLTISASGGANAIRFNNERLRDVGNAATLSDALTVQSATNAGQFGRTALSKVYLNNGYPVSITGGTVNGGASTIITNGGGLVIAITGGGAQTPWTGDIDGGGFVLTNVAKVALVGSSVGNNGTGGFAGGQTSTVDGFAGLAFGGTAYVTASGVYGSALGFNSIASNATAFVWQGSDGGYGEAAYGSRGAGTFNIRPVGGTAGFYIGATNLASLLAAKFTTNAALDLLSVGNGSGIVSNAIKQLNVTGATGLGASNGVTGATAFIYSSPVWGEWAATGTYHHAASVTTTTPMDVQTNGVAGWASISADGRVILPPGIYTCTARWTSLNAMSGSAVLNSLTISASNALNSAQSPARRIAVANGLVRDLWSSQVAFASTGSVALVIAPTENVTNSAGNATIFIQKQ